MKPKLKRQYITALNREELKESFEAKVNDPKLTYPKDIGVEHPFDFEAPEKVYKTVGFAYGLVNKYVNAIIGEFTVKTKNENATALLQSFIKNSGFKQVIHDWLIEGFSKGNGFLEIDLENGKLRVTNAKDMFVVRDEVGNETGYNQWMPSIKNQGRGTIVNFKPEKIAHVKINATAGEAYGRGVLMPNERTISNIVLADQNLHTLMARKAGMPIVFKIGQQGEQVSNDVMQAIKADLQFLTNKTEWVIDGNTTVETLDFKDVGKNLTELLDTDFLSLSYGTLIPQALMGKGNMPEGLASMNMEDWNKVIAAYQDCLEQIIEEKIFRPYLLNQGIKEKDKKTKDSVGLSLDIDFIWNLPTETSINERLSKFTLLLNNPLLDENLRRFINLDIARLLNMEKAEELIEQPAIGAQEEKKKEEEKLRQPEVPGAKPMAGQSFNVTMALAKLINADTQLEDDLAIREYVNVQEIEGFNYTDYLIKILEVLRNDPFNDLVAITESEVLQGKLSKEDIEKLRVIMKNGFKNNETIREIQKKIESGLDLKDRINEDGKLLLSSQVRPLVIARTETVRLANEGLKNLYKENNIEKVRWLAALSDRTCPQCEQLNGEVFNIQELAVGQNQPPLHPGCRCTLLSVRE